MTRHHFRYTTRPTQFCDLLISDIVTVIQLVAQGKEPKCLLEFDDESGCLGN